MKARVYKDTTGSYWSRNGRPWVCDMRHPMAGIIRHTTWADAMRDADLTGQALRATEASVT